MGYAQEHSKSSTPIQLLTPPSSPGTLQSHRRIKNQLVAVRQCTRRAVSDKLFTCINANDSSVDLPNVSRRSVSHISSRRRPTLQSYRRPDSRAGVQGDDLFTIPNHLRSESIDRRIHSEDLVAEQHNCNENIVTIKTQHSLPPMRAVPNRLRIVTELVETEQNYLDSLTMVQTVLIEPMMEATRSNSPILSPAKMSAVFSNFIDILYISTAFLGYLQDINLTFSQLSSRKDDIDLSPICELFCHFGHYFKMYKTYCRNFSAASVELENEERNNKALVRFLRSPRNSHALAGLSLHSYLLLPVQRIPRYRILLSELLKHTPEAHGEFQSIQRALELVSETATSINESIRVHEQWQKLLDIQNQILNLDMSLINVPGRIFLRKGQITQICRKSHESRELFLFSDCLIIATLSTNVIFPDFARCAYTFLGRYNLANITVEAQSHGTSTCLEKRYLWKLISHEKSFLAYCQSESERSAWLQAIRKAKADHSLAQSTFRSEASVSSTLNITHGKPLPGSNSRISILSSTFWQTTNVEYPILRDQPAPIWVEDSSASTCQQCQGQFTIFRGRHHCRLCGQLVCAACSSKRYMTSTKSAALRACDSCYAITFLHYTVAEIPGLESAQSLACTSSTLEFNKPDVPLLNAMTYRGSLRRGQAIWRQEVTFH